MDNLLLIVRKIVNPDITRSRLEQLLSLRTEDFYNELCKLSTYNPETKEITSYRATARQREINNLLRGIRLSKGAYLDIGGGDGIITSVIGKRLGYRDIYSLDVETPFISTERKETLGITYLTVNSDNPLIKLSDNSCSLVTAMMSLHHVLPPAFNKEMREICRVLKPNGYFIIREHDCRGQSDKDLIDMEHLLYDHSVKVSPLRCKKYTGDYSAFYKTKEEWTRLLGKYKFKPVGTPVFKSKNNPTRYYYQIYQLNKSMD